MFLEPGFLGTKALMYMDVITLYFALLPFFLAFSIRYAVKKEYKKHYYSQIVIFIVSLIMIILFEIGVRFSGGFIEFSKESSVSFAFLSSFLGVHIFIALLSVILWIIVLYTSLREYKAGGDMAVFATRHKRKARVLFAGLTVTSIMGVMIYIFLFVA